MHFPKFSKSKAFFFRGSSKLLSTLVSNSHSGHFRYLDQVVIFVSDSGYQQNFQYSSYSNDFMAFFFIFENLVFRDFFDYASLESKLVDIWDL